MHNNFSTSRNQNFVFNRIIFVIQKDVAQWRIQPEKSLGSFFQIIQDLHYKKTLFSKSYKIYTTKNRFFPKRLGSWEPGLYL
ncbi:hypothetical protein HanIR_Chr15g0737071 [Helianthus annuus]|nr:hypothetical protein HanIR_Chr15g0737071 [Helianthus annuus]